jgi:hypothetical protein
MVGVPWSVSPPTIYRVDTFLTITGFHVIPIFNSLIPPASVRVPTKRSANVSAPHPRFVSPRNAVLMFRGDTNHCIGLKGLDLPVRIYLLPNSIIVVGLTLYCRLSKMCPHDSIYSGRIHHHCTAACFCSTFAFIISLTIILPYSCPIDAVLTGSKD